MPVPTIRGGAPGVCGNWTQEGGIEPVEAASNAAPTTRESSSGVVGSDPSRRLSRIARSPAVAARLWRLRTELGKIVQPPCSPDEARAEIVKALARAGLADWSVPELPDKCDECDGSFRIRLLKHEIIINPWGAFRIDDLHAAARPYFEMRGCTNRPFMPPPGA